MNKVILFLFIAAKLSAQFPDTDIWLFSLKKSEQNYIVDKGENITHRIGYDNQPSFSSDEKSIIYISILDKQADIYSYKIGDKKSIQLTKTEESEYSPFYIPYNKNINSVVVEKDSAQRIWLYDEVSGLPKKILFDEDSVGYYSFLNNDTVLYYKLTEPHSLRAHSIITGKDVFIANSPVRGFKSINRHEFIFGIKDSVKVVFYTYNTVLQKAKIYCEYKSLNEDIIWHNTWGLLKSEQSTILRYDENQKSWVTLLDFSSFGIKKITRFVFDSKNKKVVLVENK